ncbi:MAG: heat-inducible transcriptional repressor HrcA [Solirubrobacteraceae bacterium]|nr:heat-inducible transcriptional repressor HrcA [Solirubrobacteraceae bacterium]
MATPDPGPELSVRQQLVLRKVVRVYQQTDLPVGSKSLASDEEIAAGPSTIRNELATLEQQGLLQHPHTSAGRIPTDAGLRYYVDHLLDETPVVRVDLDLIRRELDAAMRLVSARLSDLTDLLAVVSAPPLGTATIRHIEVLPLQPHVVAVVVITSTGGVTRRVFTFPERLDTGLVNWAAEYLNERLVGTGLGARTLQTRLRDAGLGRRESAFLDTITPTFTDLEDGGEESLYVEGTARLMRGRDLSAASELLEMLEQRRSLLGQLRAALGTGEVVVRIGAENPDPALRTLSHVAGAYGLPRRPLGTVSLIGPLGMDYAASIAVVRSAAAQLSSYVTDVYES